MKQNLKNVQSYKTISEVAKELDLIDEKTGKIHTHTLRYWETQFRQIRPKLMAGNRRYYSIKDFEIIKCIKALLKEKGMTIKGVKRILAGGNIENVDDNLNFSVNKPNLNSAKLIKKRVKNIYKIISELKEIK